MTKTLLADVDGFVPVPDLLIRRYGIVTAIVWGRIWRYCQMEHGVCQASLGKIAEELNLGIKTVTRHLEPLVTDGFLEDMTPDLRNRPHSYRDTGKLIAQDEAETGPGGRPESQGGYVKKTERATPESHSATSKGHSGYAKKTERTTPESHSTTPKKPSGYVKKTERARSKSHMKIDLKRDSKRRIKRASAGQPARERTPAPAPSRGRGPDEPKASDFPDLVLYRQVTSAFPAKASWHSVLVSTQAVRARLGRDPTPDDLHRYYSAWCDRGHNPRAVTWLEWAGDGTIPGRKGAQYPGYGSSHGTDPQPLREASGSEPEAAQILLLEVSGLAALPPSELARVEQVAAMTARYGAGATRQELIAQRARWLETHGRHGQRYSPLNFGWVEWADAVLSGVDPGGDPDPPPDDDTEYDEIMRNAAPPPPEIAEKLERLEAQWRKDRGST